MSSRALTLVAGVLTTALVATTAVAVVQTRRLGELDEQLEALAAERDALERERDRLASQPDAGGDGLLDGLLGDGGSELDGLLDGLLGDTDGLFGGLAGPAEVRGRRA
jgi:outer membrane murein-binding lipoprotein Lpp